MKTRLVIALLLVSTTIAHADASLGGFGGGDGGGPGTMAASPATTLLDGSIGPSLVAQAHETQPYHHAISLQLTTLDRTGIAVVGEHDLGWKKLTVALAVGVRTAARGEFDSATIGAGVEVRRWLRRPQTMKGLYVGARTDLARTSIEDMIDGRDIGSLVTWSMGATLGYRFVIKDRVEITPSIGTGVVIEGGLDGMSPATGRGFATVGLTAGVLF